MSDARQQEKAFGSGDLIALAAIIGLLALVQGALDSLAIGGVAFGAATWRVLALNRRRLLGLPALIVFGGLGAATISMEGFDAGYGPLAVRVLVVLAGLKLLETRTIRDFYVVIFLAFFFLATLFLRDQTIPMGLFAIGVVLVLTAILVSINSARPGNIFRQTIGHSIRLFLLALPFAAAMFAVFPRLSGPLWHFGIDMQAGRTGLSDTMEPGAINNLVLSDEIAFRVIFEDGPPPPEALYWRGPVLWQTDGRRWTRNPARTSRPDAEATGKTFDYQMIVEPSAKRWVLALDVANTVPSQLTLNEDYELLAPRDLNKRETFKLSSITDGDHRILSDRQRESGLQLPDNVTERVRNLALGWRDESGGSPEKIMASALSYFRDRSFTYTLMPPTLGSNPVDEFLFDTREGFCEHYASAFVTLMRSAGVPARIVTGYLGGETNPHSGQLVVTQAEAHAWAEIWSPDQGWIRVDPTAAVAPERVRLGLDVAGAVAQGGIPLFGLSSGFWQSIARQARWLIDSVEMAWYTGVVNFSDKRQRDLLDELGLAQLGRYGTAVVVAIGMLVILVFTWSLSLLETRSASTDPAGRLYQRYRSKLRRKGIELRVNEGPVDLDHRIRRRLAPPEAATSARIARLYVQLRYGRHPRKADLEELGRLVSSFTPRLLPDAEAREDLPKEVVRGKGAGNL